MPKKNSDHESLPVMVPRNCKPLSVVTSDRVQRLRERLQDVLRDLRKTTSSRRSTSRPAPEPEGFHAVVAQAACSLCQGYCCRNGGDEAFLDARTIARLRQANPTLTDEALIRLYAGRVPVEAYQDSCIFHGRSGCTLDRSMRADVCNTYFCRGLGDFVRSHARPEPTIVIAGEGETMRVSSVLTPSSELTEQRGRTKRSTAFGPGE
jgi:hypothetical protein